MRHHYFVVTFVTEIITSPLEAKKMKDTNIAGGKWLSPEIGFSPVADGKFLPLDPMKNFEGSDINLLIGTTADEYRFCLLYTSDAADE